MDTQPQHWILIRGLIRSRFHWGGFPALLEAALQQHQPGCRLWLPELAGNGERWQEDTPSGIHAMMEDIRQQLQLAGAYPQQTRFTLVAVSMGAMIASEWARCYPDEIHALHLINTSFANLSLPWQRMRLPALFNLLRTGLPPSSRERAILRWTTNMTDISAILPGWEAFARQHPLRWRNALTQLLSASRYRGPLQAPCDQVFCYSSQRDRLVSTVCTRRIARRWQKPLHSHPAAGHDLPLDDPHWLISRLAENAMFQGEQGQD